MIAHHGRSKNSNPLQQAAHSVLAWVTCRVQPTHAGGNSIRSADRNAGRIADLTAPAPITSPLSAPFTVGYAWVL